MARSTKAFVAVDVLRELNAEPIDLGTPEWVEWLSRHGRFQYKGEAGHFSARKEHRPSGDYWYGYRRRNGRLHKVYLGKSADLTPDRLQKAAVELAGNRAYIQYTLPQQPPEPATPVPASLFAQSKIRPTTLPPKLVARSRLTDQLQTPITIISAPGGYGKTTLLNAWRQACAPMPVAWAALDDDDDHLLRFWLTVVMALNTIYPKMGEGLLPALQRQANINSVEIATQVANELGSTPLGLVLDDFHHIKQPDILASLQSWCDHLPPGMRLIIAGRTRPPLALGRLRVQGLVTELEQEDLRFSLAEGIDFLQLHLTKPTLTTTEMERLVLRTGGWAAGLKLAALVLNKQPDSRRISDTFSGAHLYVRDYFLETALQQQPQAVQTFLLKTSILQQLSGDLCDAVTGQTNGTQMLMYLWRENLFVSRSEDQSWYHYHDLFAEMLYDQLCQQQPQQVAVLHQLAAGWYRQQNASADAVHHLLAANAWEEAASVIEEVALRQLVEYGEDSRLLRWLRQLPEGVFRRHKSLLSTYLRLSRMALPSAEIERVLNHLERELTILPHTQLTQAEQDVLAELRTIRHRYTDTQLDDNQEDARWQLIDGLKVVKPYYLPRTAAEEMQLRTLYEEAQQQGNLFVVLLAGGDYANRAYLRGQLRASEQIADQVLQYALEQRKKLPETASVALYVLCKISLERCDLNQAGQFLQQAIDVDPNPTSSNMRISLAVVHAKLQAALGDAVAARDIVRSARALQAQQPSPTWRDADLIAYEALFWLPSEEWESVEQLLGEIGDSRHRLAQRVRAEMWLRRGQPILAESLLRVLVDRPIHYELELEIQVLLVLSLYDQHKLNQAIQVLHEAVRLALPERNRRPFIDHASRLLPLFALLLHTELGSSKLRPFIIEILQAAGHPIKSIHTLLPPDTLDSLVIASLITERELEVLQLVRDGCSNQEIGRRLVIADGTVKTHLTNIYRKLNVHNRMQAVTIARKLNLY